MRPPSSHTPRKAASLPTLAAMMGGVLKMPMPTTIPTMMATPSSTVSLAWGALSDARIQIPR
jgi:hypothetical protein